MLVALAALVRVLVPAAAPAWTLQAIAVSGLLWSAGFAVYFVAYWRVLTRPRPDGKPG
ncbi:NnrS family protein [Ramlibacter sp.]|uniref:NnrS family protein n=1 Tax=Ramlibacter sp. TaxID=1917967 RepID=UPI00341F0D09